MKTIKQFLMPNFKALGNKLFNSVINVKFYILLTSTLFLYFGKISEGTWQETILITAGFRSVEKVTSLMKERKAKKKKKEVKTNE